MTILYADRIGFSSHDVSYGNFLSVTLGGGFGPDYSGSNDYSFSPFPAFALGYEGFELRSSGIGLAADLFPSEIFEAGPIIRQGAGRDRKLKDAKVKLLPEVKSKLEIGAFAGAGVPLNALGFDTESILAANVEYVQGLNGGHEGSVFAGGFSLITPVNKRT